MPLDAMRRRLLNAACGAVVLEQVGGARRWASGLPGRRRVHRRLVEIPRPRTPS